MFDQEIYDEARKEFLSYLRYTRGHSNGTCYGYNSDLGIWGRWLKAAGKDWQRVKPVDVEQFIAWQLRDQKVSVHILARRISCLSSFYRWAKKNEIVVDDPIYLADKPKRPYRIPVWLDNEEQGALEAAVKRVDDIPDNIFGQKRERVRETRRRYEMLFTLLLNSGLRISEALSLRVGDVRLVNGVAKSLRVIGKGNKERLIPMPENFGQVFGFWIKDRAKSEFVFTLKPGGKPPTPQSARAYLRYLRERAAIQKKVTPHKLRHTYATNLLNAGAELVDIQVLLGHTNLATTQIYTHVSEERMQAVVAKLAKR
jgi:integrase/recombinase XerD